MKIQRLAVVFGLSLGFALTSLPAQAAVSISVGSGYYGGGGYYHTRYYNNRYYNTGYNCYWRYGRKYCNNSGYYYQPTGYYRQHYYNNNCRWVAGHWRHGYWYPGQRVCW